jgi:cleavage and polyadenylation specificity factor subunit 4
VQRAPCSFSSSIAPFIMAAAIAKPTADYIRAITDPSHAAPTYDFSFSDFLRREHRFGLAPNRPLCKAFREGHCPLGTSCPDKHVMPHSNNNLVCKHWLRGLCKKGDACEFLHEYNV